MAGALEARFDAAVRDELAVPGTREPQFALGLPPALRETLVAFGPDMQAESYYCDRMPRMLVEQMLRGDDPARRLLWRPLRAEGRVREALDGLHRVLQAEQLSFADLTGAESPERLLRERPSVAAMAAPTLLGSGVPLVGAWPGERELINAELQAGKDPDAELDLRLSGGVVHDVCHGVRRELRRPPIPWMVAEAAAGYLGALAWPRHTFPEVAGEAVPGTSLFVLVGQGLARLFGRRALLRLVVEGAALPDAFGERVAAALEAAARRDWEARRQVPFARDALNALEWIRLADEARGGTRWADEPVSAEDVEMARTAARAMFQANVLSPTYQTHPCEPAALILDADSCTLSRPPEPRGVFGEPAFWMMPPNLCRRLRQRRIVVERPRLSDIDGLVERWTSSNP